MEGSLSARTKGYSLLSVVLLLMKSIIPSLKPPSCFMVLMNCSLRYQRKMLEGIISLSKTSFSHLALLFDVLEILTLQGLKALKVELKGGLPKQFTHELEPFLWKQST
ncbi:unnamed protein product [Eruca vesicaria subsp. sativa]|uniref:Uncharacterized protein n=1 Tax=Eruca vesicaria subsp. sativa TaxID=29727 RepID=A0ABC8JKE2_ERUVS|nr:unnamed protein product [Eruca vesicaria subsp. sativa]